MAVNVYASDTTIFITWGSPLSAAVLRSADGGETWNTLRSAVTGGRFADADAVPGVRYRYMVRIGNDESVSDSVWIQPLWGWNTVTQAWTANDLVNRPTFRARILDATRRLSLAPEMVTSAECSVFEVLDSDVNRFPRYDLIAGPETLEPQSVLLPNLIVDRIWCDSTGFNFRHTPQIDLDPGTYAFRYSLATVGEPVLVSFMYDSSKRRALNG